jgi:imidazolonepropionase
MSQPPSLRSATTLVWGARQLLTLRGEAGPRRGAALGELGIITDGAVLIRGGRILETGPSRRVENLALARGANEINAAGRVVAPGFVDSRTQPLPALRQAKRLEARTQSVLEGMLRHGTTTIAASAGGGQDFSRVLAALRVLNNFNGRPLAVVPDYWATAPAEPEAICAEVLPALARRKLAQLVSVDCEAFDEPGLKQILEQARALGFRSTVRARVSPGCLRIAIEMQAAAIVLEGAEPATVAALAGSGAICTLIPAPVYERRREHLPARNLIEAGAAVALASGFGFEHCRTYNMQMVIALACSQMGMSPAEAIVAATINGAYAVSRSRQCGSLEPGKAADVLLLNIDDYRELPEQFGVNHVHMVLKNGREVYREGEVTSWAGQ